MKIDGRTELLDAGYHLRRRERFYGDTRIMPSGLIKKVLGLHVKYPIFLPDFNKAWLFSTDIPIIPQYQISWGMVRDKVYSGNSRTELVTSRVVFRCDKSVSRRRQFRAPFENTANTNFILTNTCGSHSGRIRRTAVAMPLTVPRNGARVEQCGRFLYLKLPAINSSEWKCKPKF
jgi:hypothetical protein